MLQTLAGGRVWAFGEQVSILRVPRLRKSPIGDKAEGVMADSDMPGDTSFNTVDEDGLDQLSPTETDQRRMALQNILDAWDEALSDGVSADILATTAIFAALSDMVEAYGEEAVAEMAAGLADRVRQGEFTLNRVMN
jgi:hypothetical protein